MTIITTAEHTRTFAELRKWAFEKAGVSNHIAFNKLGSDYVQYWEGINDAEFRRGYVPGEYEKPGTPALCEMRLLTEKEFAEWQRTFEFFHKK